MVGIQYGFVLIVKMFIIKTNIVMWIVYPNLKIALYKMRLNNIL